jgi:hypothetical protein
MRYNGGLIRAFRDSDPILGDLHAAGWEFEFNLPSGFTVEQDPINPRLFHFIKEWSDGSKEVKDCSIPFQIYRGIFKQSETYNKGDMVTWDGGLWHCQMDNPKMAPGKSEDWKLAVRRGQAGKDGPPGPHGPKGDRGERGEPGRDLR